MALSRRQQRLYTDRVNIWDRTDPSDVDGDPQDCVFTLLYSNIPAKYQYTLNVDDPSEVGDSKRKTALTTDTLHLPLIDDLGRTLSIPNGAYFVNVTPNNPNRRSVSIGQGAPNLLPGAGMRSDLNKMSVQVMSQEHPPADVLIGVAP